MATWSNCKVIEVKFLFRNCERSEQSSAKGVGSPDKQLVLFGRASLRASGSLCLGPGKSL